MRKYKISYCEFENCGVRYYSTIRVNTLRTAKTIMNALKKENYDVALYKLKKDGKTDLDYDFVEQANYPKKNFNIQ